MLFPCMQVPHRGNGKCTLAVRLFIIYYEIIYYLSTFAVSLPAGSALRQSWALRSSPFHLRLRRSSTAFKLAPRTQRYVITSSQPPPPPHHQYARWWAGASTVLPGLDLKPGYIYKKVALQLVPLVPGHFVAQSWQSMSVLVPLGFSGSNYHMQGCRF